MRLAYSSVLLASSLAACGSELDNPTSSATDSGGNSSSTGSSATTQETPTTSGNSVSGSSSGGSSSGSISDSMTDGTTTATTSTSTGSTTATTTATDGTTNPIDTDTGPDETTGSTGPDQTTGSTGSGESGSESTTGDVEACACPDIEVPLDDGIFVLSITAELWKFFPENNSFQLLGDLACDLPPATFSMAVDRLGFAWVQFSGGELRKVSVTDVSDCSDPGYVVGQNDVFNFGMAFVSNSASDACDRIYGNVASGLSEGNMVSDFFSIDPVTLTVEPISKSDYGTAEVTGTGDGRAFFFAGANPAKLIEIDKATGAKLGVIPLPGVELGNAWAFAFFAGDFYFFTNSQGGPGSEVTHIDYDDSDKNGQQDITIVVPNAPMSIVGAGVSTCAPTAPQ